MNARASRYAVRCVTFRLQNAISCRVSVARVCLHTSRRRIPANLGAEELRGVLPGVHVSHSMPIGQAADCASRCVQQRAQCVRAWHYMRNNGCVGTPRRLASRRWAAAMCAVDHVCGARAGGENLCRCSATHLIHSSSLRLHAWRWRHCDWQLCTGASRHSASLAPRIM